MMEDPEAAHLEFEEGGHDKRKSSIRKAHATRADFHDSLLHDGGAEEAPLPFFLRKPKPPPLPESVTRRLKEIMRKVKRQPKTMTGQLQEDAYRTLTTVSPFSYLPHPELRALVQRDLERLEFQDGQIIIHQGAHDDDVFVLAQERVVMIRFRNDNNNNNNNNNKAFKFVGYLDAPAYFGEWGTLFAAPRNSQIVAAGSSVVVVYRLAGKRFQQLVQQHAAFRLKLALGLRRHGIFAPMDQFVAAVRRAVQQDTAWEVTALLRSYRQMVPAIHANLQSSDLDLDGWTYAVRRLPATITSTYVYLLSTHVPLPFVHLPRSSVPTVARRRQALALDRGKLLVVMRETFSDVLDFVTLLCCHLHESAKLRAKLVASVDAIHACLWARPKETDGTGGDGYHAYHPAPLDEQAKALRQLPLTTDEQEGLKRLWPRDYLYRIWEIICLHENVQLRSDLEAASVHATDRWAEGIRIAVIELLDRDLCVQTDIVTHVISSNTTSIRNLLSPYLLQHRARILEWGRETHPDISNHSVLSESDKFCALCNAYLKAHPAALPEMEDSDRACFRTLRHTELTGIQVELIDLNALEAAYAQQNLAPDPFLEGCFSRYDTNAMEWKPVGSSSRPQARLLVNIDYAFGKQAEQLISALSLLFGKSLASVGVMGKAGGLQGRRGDIIVADYLVHQEGDEQTWIDNTGVDRNELHRLSQRQVHSGGVLTVLGTLLQDARLLHFYKKLYGCVSLEMEGSFYARELQRYKKAGLLKEDIQMRFLYYVSDTPLSQDQTETLSSDMSLAEVIPPQYAVTRALLKPVLAQH